MSRGISVSRWMDTTTYRIVYPCHRGKAHQHVLSDANRERCLEMAERQYGVHEILPECCMYSHSPEFCGDDDIMESVVRRDGYELGSKFVGKRGSPEYEYKFVYPCYKNRGHVYHVVYCWDLEIGRARIREGRIKWHRVAPIPVCTRARVCVCARDTAVLPVSRSLVLGWM